MSAYKTLKRWANVAIVSATICLISCNRVFTKHKDLGENMPTAQEVRKERGFDSTLVPVKLNEEKRAKIQNYVNYAKKNGYVDVPSQEKELVRYIELALEKNGYWAYHLDGGRMITIVVMAHIH